MSTPLPQTSSTPSAAWDDHDQYPTVNRGHSNSTSSQLPLSMMQGQGRQRNGFGANGEKGVPVPGSTLYGNGADRKSSLQGTAPLFDVARSPPSNSSKSESDWNISW